MQSDRLRELAGLPLTEGRIERMPLIVDEIFEKAEADATNEAAESGSAVSGDRIMAHADNILAFIRSSLDKKIREGM